MNKLAEVQKKLKAPKGQFNKLGGYNYRNCEDILEALKPLLGDCTVIVTDSIEVVADRIYVVATAEFHDGQNTFRAKGYAREPLQKKGMDESQITGAASSYARKYALNGLFLIDDTKDADHGNTSDSYSQSYTDEQKEKFDQLMELQNSVAMFLFHQTFNTTDASSGSAAAWAGLTNSFPRGQKGKMGGVLQAMLNTGREEVQGLYVDLRKFIHAQDDTGIQETLDGVMPEAIEFIKNKLTAEDAKYLQEIGL